MKSWGTHILQDTVPKHKKVSGSIIIVILLDISAVSCATDITS